MLEDFYTRPRAIARFMRAPLGPYMGSFADEMRARGYTHAVVRVQLCFVARLNRWLERHRLRVDELDESRLQEFLRSKYRKSGLGMPKTVSSFLEHLRCGGIAAVPAAPRRRLTRSETIERDFTSYLEQQRGLAASTVVGYVAGARAFLDSRFGSGPVRLARLNAGQVAAFVTDYAHRRGATATQTIATALRSFLRFLQQREMSSVTSPLRFRAWHVGSSPRCRRFSRAMTSTECSQSARGAPRLAEIGRSWCYSRDWACEPARLFGSRWTTSTGTPASSRSEARPDARTGCRCRAMSAQLLPLTSATSARAAHRDTCSFGHVHRTTVSVARQRSVPSYVGSFAGLACYEGAAPRTCFGMLPPRRCFVGERLFM
jgi:hypothetical protein